MRRANREHSRRTMAKSQPENDAAARFFQFFPFLLFSGFDVPGKLGSLLFFLFAGDSLLFYFFALLP